MHIKAWACLGSEVTVSEDPGLRDIVLCGQTFDERMHRHALRLSARVREFAVSVTTTYI